MKQTTSMANKILIDKNGEYIFDLASISQDVSFNIKKGVITSINLKGFKDKTSLTFNLEKDAICDLKFLLENDKKDIDLQGNLYFNACFNVFFADYANDNLFLKSMINLKEENSKTNVNFTSLGKANNLKKFDISFNHLVPKTTSNFEGYAVSMKDSFIKINGVSHIVKDAISSEAHQKVKCLLFDEKSRAIANPVLKIDCDDIIASHACAIGSLNNDHIFYLLSRGLSLEEARRLIITGYLLPIKQHFNDDDKKKITEYVEGDF